MDVAAEASVPAASAPIPDVQAAPVAAEPVAAVQADQPATVPATAVEAPPAQAAVAEPPAHPEVPKSLLDKFDEKAAPVEAKPEDKPAEEAPKPADAPPVEEPKAETPPVEEPKPAVEEPPVQALDPIDWFADEGGIKVPEVVALDDASRTKLTEALELGRTDPTKGAQALMDMHAAALDQFAADVHTKMWTQFGETRKGWQTQVMADPILGGNGHDTAMGVVARMRDSFITRAEPGTPEHAKHMADWKDFMDTTGAGDHPALLRFMHNVGHKFDEASPPPPDPKPPADLGRKPGQKGKLNYTHPTSTPGN